MDNVINGFITFLGTNKLEETHRFYTEILGLKIIKDQDICKIYRVIDSTGIGFCQHMSLTIQEKSPIITFLCESVDRKYKELKDKGINIKEEPKKNKKFNIYHFFVEDPNGYTIEFQRFLE